MSSKLFEVLEEFNPKIHHVSLIVQQSKCFKLFKKGDKFQPKIFMETNQEYFKTDACTNAKNASKYALNTSLKIAKGPHCSSRRAIA